MFVGGEYRVEAVLLLVGEQPDAGADGCTDPGQVITGLAPPSVQFSLQPPPHLIELRTDECDNVDGVHDRGGIRHHFGGSFLVAGEGIHSDVVNAGAEGIGLIFQLVSEDVG